jgi:hypothetical protein
MAKRGTIAFITTPKFRESSPELAQDFVYAHLYELCDPFSVITTGRTGLFIHGLVDRDPNDVEREKIRLSMGLHDLSNHDLDRWRRTIRESLTVTMDRLQGMIHVTYELVEGRLDGVIHLTDWEDKSANPDSAVLSREANSSTMYRSQRIRIPHWLTSEAGGGGWLGIRQAGRSLCPGTSPSLGLWMD